MAALTLLHILRELDRSNCGECGRPTCMAFAAGVVEGRLDPSACPRLDRSTQDRLRAGLSAVARREASGEEALLALMARFPGVNLPARAEALGGWLRDGRLALHCLGKVFALDQAGGLHSECHQNPWLHVPLLAHVLDGAGQAPAADWVRFAELRSARSWIRFFEHRCEEPLGELSQREPELLADILDLFAQRRNIPGFAAAQTFLLKPLPLVPVLFCLEPADGELPASFAVYFDRSVEANLDAESIFWLGSGMARMFLRIAERHGSAAAGA